MPSCQKLIALRGKRNGASLEYGKPWIYPELERHCKLSLWLGMKCSRMGHFPLWMNSNSMSLRFRFWVYVNVMTCIFINGLIACAFFSHAPRTWSDLMHDNSLRPQTSISQVLVNDRPLEELNEPKFVSSVPEWSVARMNKNPLCKPASQTWQRLPRLNRL